VSAPLTLIESADLLGRYRYVELATFAALGERAKSAESAGVQRFLAGASLGHGWRARIVEERLPVSVGLPGTEASTRSPSPFVDQAIAVLVGPGPDGDLLEALLGAFYPAMLVAYDARIALAAPAPDGPIVRALGRIRHDLATVTAEGNARFPVRHPAARSTEISRLLGESGGPFGPIVEARDIEYPAAARSRTQSQVRTS
jgi:hypothetical protein